MNRKQRKLLFIRSKNKRRIEMKCPCGCEDNDEGQIYPFICNRCHGFYDCEYVIDGLCQCPECDIEAINKIESEKQG
jgi:hypothetical protein